MHYAFRFLLATLAVWRISHMLSLEDGPWRAFQRFRSKLEYRVLGQLVTCFYCLSIWVALPFAWFLKGDVAETFVGWMALSGGAILLERLSREPVELKIEEEHPWDVVAKR